MTSLLLRAKMRYKIILYRNEPCAEGGHVIKEDFGRKTEAFLKVTRESVEQDDAITDSFRSAVRHTVDFTKARGCPIARYYVKRKEAYLEYPDGSKVYHGKA